MPEKVKAWATRACSSGHQAIDIVLVCMPLEQSRQRKRGIRTAEIVARVEWALIPDSRYMMALFLGVSWTSYRRNKSIVLQAPDRPIGHVPSEMRPQLHIVPLIGAWCFDFHS